VKLASEYLCDHCFQDCLTIVHKDEANAAYNACVFDTCIDDTAADKYLCIHATCLGDLCYERGVKSIWRKTDFCRELKEDETQLYFTITVQPLSVVKTRNTDGAPIPVRRRVLIKKELAVRNPAVLKVASARMVLSARDKNASLLVNVMVCFDIHVLLCHFLCTCLQFPIDHARAW
jgi:hypothetical protein